MARSRPDLNLPAATLDAVTLGEPLVLFAAESSGPLESVGRFARHSAGAEFNVAIGLARLEFRVGYIGRVGNDAFGRYLLDCIDREGIDSAHVVIDAQRPTGFMLKSRCEDGGDPLIEYHRRGSAASAMSIAEYPSNYASAARHLHLTGIAPALSKSCRELVFHAARAARANGQSVSFDPNLRPRLWRSREEMITTLNALATLSDLVLPGLAEGRLLTGCHRPEDIADFYLERGARQVVVKLGPEGAYCASHDAGSCTLPAQKVTDVVDTVGAGDGFAVGVVSGLLDGLALPEAAARGNRIGARALRFPGDCDGLPTRSEL